jgi:hypothetical protein
VFSRLWFGKQEQRNFRAFRFFMISHDHQNNFDLKYVYSKWVFVDQINVINQKNKTGHFCIVHYSMIWHNLSLFLILLESLGKVGDIVISVAISSIFSKSVNSTHNRCHYASKCFIALTLRLSVSHLMIMVVLLGSDPTFDEMTQVAFLCSCMLAM